MTAPTDQTPAQTAGPPDSKWWIYIKRLFLGPLYLHPLTRREFLPKAAMVYFVRQLWTTAISVAVVSVMEEAGEWEDLLAPLWLIAIAAELCFYIPYFRLIYWRTLGTVFPRPVVVMAVTLFVGFYIYPPLSGGADWIVVLVEQSYILSIYLILLLLPDRKPSAQSAE